MLSVASMVSSVAARHVCLSLFISFRNVNSICYSPLNFQCVRMVGRESLQGDWMAEIPFFFFWFLFSFRWELCCRGSSQK